MSFVFNASNGLTRRPINSEARILIGIMIGLPFDVAYVTGVKNFGIICLHIFYLRKMMKLSFF